MENVQKGRLIGSFAKVQGGFAFRRSDFCFEGIPVIKIKNITPPTVDLHNVQCVSREVLESISRVERYVLSPGDILIAMTGATLGKVGRVPLTNQPILLNQRVGRIDVTNPLELDRDYLFYVLSHDLNAHLINKMGEGSAQANVSSKEIESLEVALPPLVEQKRIVTKIEALFSRLDSGANSLKQVRAQLKKIRQSLQAHAFAGRLTEDWRKSHEADVIPASELRLQIATERQNVSKKRIKHNPSIGATNLRALPETWVWVTIGEVETFIGSGITPRGGSTTYLSEGVPFIRSQNVWPSGLRLGDVAFISNEQHDIMSRTKIHPRDVLLNITGASIGRSTYVPEDFCAGNVNQHVSIIRTINSVHYKFLSNFLNSPLGQDEIFSTQSGMTRQALNYDQIRSLVMPLTSFAEQIQIVKQLESSFRIINSVQRVTERSIKQTDGLKQLILKKAFEGRLVPNEAELAKSERRSYEPANVLERKKKAKLQNSNLKFWA